MGCFIPLTINSYLSFSSNWELVCKLLQSYPKGKPEDGAPEVVHRSMGKRRTSHQSSEHELEDQINEWANMTWFLVALGGVCLQQRPRAYRTHFGPSTSQGQGQQAGAAGSSSAAGGSSQHSSQQSMSMSVSSMSSSGRGTYHSHFSGPVSQEVLYCPVTQ